MNAFGFISKALPAGAILALGMAYASVANASAVSADAPQPASSSVTIDAGTPSLQSKLQLG